MVTTMRHEQFDKTDEEYSLAPTDDLIGFWRSKVKVIAGHRGGEGIHVHCPFIFSFSVSF